MPDLSSVTAPVEWVVTHSASKDPIAVVRRLRLGPQHELFFRAVTWHTASAKRELVGYWASLEEAVQNVYGLYERSLPPQFLMTGGGTTRQPQPLTKPKPPPASARVAQAVQGRPAPSRSEPGPASVPEPAGPAAARPAPARPSRVAPVDRQPPARQLATAGG